MVDSKFRDWFIKQQTLLQDLKNREVRFQTILSDTERRHSNVVKSQEIVNAVIIATLEEVKTFIEDTVTLCLSTVFGNEYSLKVDYQVKRGKSEAVVRICKGQEVLDPRDEVGGGVIDVASIGLRLVLWLLSVPRSDPVFVFDEPFRFVSLNLTPKVIEMLKEVCNTFGAQVIMVSHNEELIEEASKTIRVTWAPEGSIVEEV